MALKQVQPALAYAAAHLDEDLSLSALAAQTGLSVFHLHRLFSATTGETPKQLTQRLRLSRAAAMLLTGRDSILDIALSCGFQSHEVFCRAFRRRFGIAPNAYRARGFAKSVNRAQVSGHASLVARIGPCVGLYHRSHTQQIQGGGMNYSIIRKELAPQPVLVVRRRVKRSEIAATIGEVLPQVFAYAERNGIALAGLPFTRYVEVGPGLLTIEPGMRVAAPAQSPAAASGETEVIAETLPGGPVATTTHCGPYDKLSDAYGAIELWMQAQGLASSGAPWESYVNDPAEYPDPKDWKTDVFWPLAQ
jgi:AraC-like DNA-binding protein/effector-binding domain-containing protein